MSRIDDALEREGDLFFSIGYADERAQLGTFRVYRDVIDKCVLVEHHLNVSRMASPGSWGCRE